MYRMRWPALAMQAAGYSVRVARNNPAVIMQNNTVIGMAEDLNADIVVFQRPARIQHPQMFEFLHQEGYKVVIDMDDDLTSIHPMNPAHQSYNFHGDSGDMHWRFCSQSCEMADIVTVTTPRLLEVYGGDKGVVVPNCIPESYLSVKRPENEFVTVGWAGHVATHPDDLQITHGAVNQAIALTKGKSRFLALGDEKTLDNLAIRRRLPNEWLKGVKMAEYPEFVAQLDIGIVPLTSSPFNQAKSWLKALEYASLGVVPVVSPTEDNMRMVEAGAAVVAHNPKEWALRIKELIEDDERRQELARRAREFASGWTIEGNTPSWAKAWGLELI